VLRNSVHSDFYRELLDTCEHMDFTLEGLHEETGPGVLEGAIGVDAALAAADKAALFKTFTKIVAQRCGLMATFMAKWSPDWPGQSGHIHRFESAVRLELGSKLPLPNRHGLRNYIHLFWKGRSRWQKISN
jgi:hypothetical protein